VRTTTKTSSKAQAPFATKAAKLKAIAAAKRPQPPWLRRSLASAPAREAALPSATPERITEAHRSQGPPRLMSKREVVATVGATFPTIWKMVRRGEFPPGLRVGGKTKWRSDQVAAWMDALEIKQYRKFNQGE
jgi:predicted DNA-binding transcriptional regulator AlpA